MTDQQLLIKIWDKVEYLNHITTQNQTDIAWIKWLVMGIAATVLVRVVGYGVSYYKKNNK